MTERVIPLTPAGPAWSQREYVECQRLQIGFAAHRHGSLGQVFHYHFPTDPPCCTSILIDCGGRLQYIDHSFAPGIDWLDRCVKSMPKEAA